MIVGLGIDSIEIDRVREKCEAKGTHFAEKMFTTAELASANRGNRVRYEHLAACFAAREAFFKATQIWYDRQRVSVAQRDSGEPYYILSEEIAGELAGRTLHLSITHDRTHATAVCICEEER